MLIVKCSVMIKTNIVIKGKVILFYRWKKLFPFSGWRVADKTNNGFCPGCTLFVYPECLHFDKGNGVRPRGYDRSYGVEPEVMVTL